MAIQRWQPSTLYLKDQVIYPTSVAGASPATIPNADFESGDTGWTKGTGWAINTNLPFQGTYSAEYSGPGAAEIVSDTKVPVAPGKSITAACFVHQGASDDGQANAAVILRWYDAGDVFISDSAGNTVSTGAVTVWNKSTVSAVAPPNAASVSIGCTAYNDWAVLNVDGFSWNYVTGVAASSLAFKATFGDPATPPSEQNPDLVSYTGTDIYFQDGKIYRSDNSNPGDIVWGWLADGFKPIWAKISGASNPLNNTDVNIQQVTNLALHTGSPIFNESAGATITVTQNQEGFSNTGSTGSTSTATSGTSGTTEPLWPTEVGGSVVDNNIIWVAVGADSVTWEASSILTSGSQEPTWPTTANSYVGDNNIAWECVPLRITDENCPHTKVVAIAASKVFAGDTDIVRFCATLNARDWSSEDDAGFLPTGLQQKSQVGVDAMGVYRGNLAVWSGSTFQVWQVDPDPAAMALLDAMEGIGSIYQQAVQPVSDDLFFLSSLGVRTVSIAAGSNNLAAGDAGVPIDPLVQAEKDQPDVEPVATYYPGAGQYWLAFRPLTVLAALLAGQFLLTSPPYPLQVEDAIQGDTVAVRGTILGAWGEDAFEIDSLGSHGTNPQLIAGETGFEDAFEGDSEPVVGYFDGDIVILNVIEDAIIGNTVPVDGTIEGKLISYENQEDAIIGGTTAGYGTLL